MTTSYLNDYSRFLQKTKQKKKTDHFRLWTISNIFLSLFPVMIYDLCWPYYTNIKRHIIIIMYIYTYIRHIHIYIHEQCRSNEFSIGGAWFVVLSYEFNKSKKHVLAMLVFLIKGSFCCLFDLFIFLFENDQNKSHRRGDAE